MKKIVLLMAVASMVVIGAFAASSHASKMTTEGWSTYDFTHLRTYFVRNPQGQYLGRMQDIVVDPDGRIVFAIVTRPGVLGIRGKPVAVPFEGLSLKKDKYEFVLDMTAEQFASVPDFTNMADLHNPAWASTIYRQFGIQPYWMEK